MRITKSRTYKNCERALAAAKTQEDVSGVVMIAKANLNDKEFGHFLNKAADRRQKLADVALAKQEEATAW